MNTIYFQAGGSLSSDAPSYLQRRADQDLYDALRRGEFCYVLNSRQMGKSSLLVHTRDRLISEGYRCATLDLTHIGSQNTTPLQWYKGIVKDLWRSFKLMGQFKVNDWWKEEEDVSLLQRLSYFIADVLLQHFPDQQLVIFIDEVDSTLNLSFSTDDFFALIRYCYNQRATNSDFKRLSFAIFGVAAPADLIQERTRTPFNLGTAIEIQGFTLAEAQPLAAGLAVEAGNHHRVLEAILDWTQGQPFLTQKLCQLAIGIESVSGILTIPPGSEADWVEHLVKERVLKEWEIQDEPEHFRTIRNRLLHNPANVGRLLDIYQQVLEGHHVSTDDSPEQLELLLAGLMTKQNGRFKPKCKIYERIFNLAWVEQQLSDLRPYGTQLKQWIASGNIDESRLLRGQALKDAQVWSQGKRLSDADYQFLATSVDCDRQAVRKAMDAERQAAEAERVQFQLQQAQHTTKLQRRFLGAVTAAFLITVGLGGLTFAQYRSAQIGEIEALAIAAEGRFEAHHQLEALQQIITARTKLDNLWSPPEELTRNVKWVLQAIIDGTYADNQLDFQTGVSGIDIHPSQDLMAVTTLDGQLSFWQTNGQQVNIAIRPEAAVQRAVFDRSGDRIALSLSNRQLQVWSLRGVHLQTIADLPPGITQLTFSADGQTLLLGGKRKSLYELNLQDGRRQSFPTSRPLGFHTFSADDRFVIAAKSPFPHNSDLREEKRFHNVMVWDQQRNPITSFISGGGPLFGLVVHPTQNMIATANHTGLISLMTFTGKPVQTIKQGAEIRALAFSPDGQQLATANTDGGITLWNLGIDLLKEDGRGSVIQRFLGHQGRVRTLRFSADGQRLVSASEDGTVRLWSTRHPLHSALVAHRVKVAELFFQGKQLWSFGPGSEMLIWERDASQAWGPLPHRKIERLVNAKPAAISQDGTVVVHMSNPHTITFSNAMGKPQQQLYPPTQLKAIALNHIGDRLAAAGVGNRIYIWFRDASGQFSAQPTHILNSPKPGITSLAWHPDRAVLAVGSQSGNLQFWEHKAKQSWLMAADWPAHTASINQLKFSPDGRVLASGGGDNQLHVWQTQDRRLVQSLTGHQAPINDFAFRSDSQQLASASMDRTVKVFTLDTTQPEPLLRTLTGHEGRVNAVTFSPDGTEIISGGDDRKIIVWQIQDILALDELTYACHQVQKYLQNSSLVKQEDRSLCKKDAS